ncbi:MAG: molybdopterin-dependent oxidoreductase [Candidatus Schekmanbacteria bacterium]|nr:molybdopterin-dependent oxidoreductase [Candidatus Schekmanbacteria bacterium]
MGTSRATVCPFCEAMCGLLVTVEGGRVAAIEGDAADPLSRGHLCPKAFGLRDLHEDPDRLRQPLCRRGGELVPCTWDEAFAAAAKSLRGVQAAGGRDAVALYRGNPVAHNYAALLGSEFVAKSLGTRNVYSANSVDALPLMFAANLLYGHPLLVPVPDIDRCELLLMLGANPVVSNGSALSAPGIRERLRQLRERGGRLIVVDPRRTETAEIADEHVSIVPGTDAALLLALLHEIVAKRRERLDRLASMVTGLDELRELVAPFAPEWVAPMTGVPADVIARLAHSLATATAAACYGRVGVSTQSFGGLCCWLIQVLNIVTGNLDRPGGTLFPRAAVDIAATPFGRGPVFGAFRSRVRGLPSFAGELPVAALAEEIETPGVGQIRGLVTIAGNPVLSTPDGTRLDRAIAGLEAYVAVDFYRNETTRHAQVILPPPSPAERDHFDLFYRAFAVRNVERYAPAILARPAGQPAEWDILCRLAARVAAGREARRFAVGVVAAGLRAIGAPRIIEALLSIGRGRQRPSWRSVARLSEQYPSGRDLGGLEPCLPARLKTRPRRLALHHEAMASEAERLKTALVAAADRPAGDTASLLLVGRRELRSNNSWMHNLATLAGGKDRCTLMMNPLDAAARQIVSASTVLVTSATGELRVPVRLTAAMRPGVVSLPHGWGHDRAGAALSLAAQAPGASYNDLTAAELVDAATGTSVLNGIPVTVRAAAS